MGDREQLARPTIRMALFLGFGLTVGIWMFAGYYFTRRIADVERDSAAIAVRYMRAQDLLSAVRGQVLLASVYMRDALLDPNPSTAGDYRLRLEESYEIVDNALQQYVPVLDSEAERGRVAHLRGEIGDFQRTMLDVLATDATRWRTEARSLLNTRVVPKRAVVIDLSEQVQALNRGAFLQQQSVVGEIYRVTQRRVLLSLGAALVASLGIALLATRYSGRLENRIRRQGERNAQNARELQHLSAKLLQVQDDERRSIARELHDEIGQALTAIKVELAVAQRAIESAGGAPNALSDARSIADGLLHTVRDLSHLLHPALLDDLGLVAVTEWYLKGFTKRHGIRADLLHDRMEERLMPETEVAAYRIIQEALTNVAKHAKATSCRVYLQRLTNTLLVTVEDDGAGFDPANTRSADGSRGLGLIGIRERAAQLQGTVQIESGRGKGTRLTVELAAETRTNAPDGSSLDTVQAVAAAPQAREAPGG